MQYCKTVVDGHYHIYNWSNSYGKDFYETTDAYVNARNFRSVNLCALPCVWSDVRDNIIAALYKLHNPNVYIHGGITHDVYPVPAVATEGFDPLTQYNEMMEIGFDGIKIIETKPDRINEIGRPVNDPFYGGFFKAAERDGTHIVWHVNDPAEFWDKDLAPDWCFANGWFYGDGNYPHYTEIYDQVLDVLDKNPNLKATFAHFFFMSGSPERLEELFAKYPNMGVDLTPGSEMYADFKKRHEYFKTFFTRHADRIMFGTDSADASEDVSSNTERADIVYDFLAEDKEFNIWDVPGRGLALSDEVQEKILSGNFLKKVGCEPKPINVEALKRYVAKYRHLIRDKEVQRKIDEAVAKL